MFTILANLKDEMQCLLGVGQGSSRGSYIVTMSGEK